MSRWRKENPRKYTGSTDPVKTEQWLQHIEKLFSYLAPAKEDRVRLVVRQLEEDALEWWLSVSAGRDAQDYTWKEFMELFNKEYFPESVRWKKRTEFGELQQGKMTVAEYERVFQNLNRYVPEVTAEDYVKSHKFETSLRPELCNKVEPF